MQLNMTTDYAVRLLLALAQTRERISASELGMQMNIPKPYVAKIMVCLKARGWLDVTGGVSGGYMLAVPPETISLRQVFEAMADEIILCGCLETDDYCNWQGAETCQLRRVYGVIQQKLNDMLNDVTLKSLLDESRA